MEKPEVVFVLGGPGAGKGTQCAKVMNEFGIPHISAGDCLREEQSNPNTVYGESIGRCIREGSIVPVRVTLTLLLRKMLLKGFRGLFLIDGFPRNLDNLSGWLSMTSSANLPSEIARIASESRGDELLQKRCAEVLERIKANGQTAPGSLGSAAQGGGGGGGSGDGGLPDVDLSSFRLSSIDSGVGVRFCLFFGCSEDEMIKRILKRAVSSGREDDNEASLRKRFLTYQASTLPIVNFFSNNGCTKTIDGAKSEEEVFEDVKNMFEPFREAQIQAIKLSQQL